MIIARSRLGRARCSSASARPSSRASAPRSSRIRAAARRRGASAFLGRHSLALYLVHQPVFFAGFTAVAMLLAPMPNAHFEEACRAQCVASGAEAQKCEKACDCTAREAAREDALPEATDDATRERARLRVRQRSRRAGVGRNRVADASSAGRASGANVEPVDSARAACRIRSAEIDCAAVNCGSASAAPIL